MLGSVCRKRKEASCKALRNDCNKTIQTTAVNQSRSRSVSMFCYWLLSGYCPVLPPRVFSAVCMCKCFVKRCHCWVFECLEWIEFRLIAEEQWTCYTALSELLIFFSLLVIHILIFSYLLWSGLKGFFFSVRRKTEKFVSCGTESLNWSIDSWIKLTGWMSKLKIKQLWLELQYVPCCLINKSPVKSLQIYCEYLISPSSYIPACITSFTIFCKKTFAGRYDFETLFCMYYGVYSC